MFKQKPKYERPAIEMRWLVPVNVIAASGEPYNSAGAEAEGFATDGDVITF